MSDAVQTYLGGVLATPDGLRRGWLRTEGGVISALGAGRPETVDGEPIDLDGAVLVPGFVDIHCHGGGGSSLYSGRPEDIRTAAAAHLRRGTTSMLGSVGTVEPEAMLRAVAAVAEAATDPGVPNLVGVHLEGPFLAHSHRGAQTASALRVPDAALMERLLGVVGDLPVMMTIAPELDGAVELIEEFSSRCRFSIGHTAATFEQALAAVEAGAVHMTHAFNAMPGLHHREPGPVALALSDERLTFEIVGDGHHVAPQVIRVAARAAGDRLTFVTDAMPAAGLGDGSYVFADREVDVVGGVARLKGTDKMAGSTAFLADALRLAVEGVGLDLATASHMVSATPARAAGLVERGVLRPGARADLVVLGPDLGVREVVVGGEPLAA